jgi:proteasome lid subunit RPN8/RPN11
MFDEFKGEIKRQALESYPSEVCGVFLEKNGEMSLKQCKNIALKTEKRFIISPKELFQILAEDYLLVGYYHSHHNENLSDVDKTCSDGFGLPIVCYSFGIGDFLEYSPNTYKNYYTGRRFKIGENDCFSLVRDFYKTEFNISIHDYHRTENWVEQNPYIIWENFEKEGFVKVESTVNLHILNRLQRGDIFLMRFVKTIEHFAIFLNGEILHHPRGQFSCIEPLSDSMMKRIVGVVRHKTRC